MGEDGLQVVLTPLQFAAILESDSIEQSSCTSNRFWGAVTVVGGAIELIGAAGLWLIPEPTTVTKVAGTVLGVHGADTLSTGLVQVVSCQTHTTLTSQAAAAAAKALGADPQTAGNVGFAIDIAVPLLAGFAGAARIVAIRRGAISLAAEEAAGGHTIARHVGRTEAQLRARLAAQPAIPAASTFATLKEAEKVVAAALRAQQAAIRSWASTATAGQRLAVVYDAQRIVGQGVVRSTGVLTNMTRVRVVVEKTIANNRVYFVLTAFPIP